MKGIHNIIIKYITKKIAQTDTNIKASFAFRLVTTNVEVILVLWKDLNAK